MASNLQKLQKVALKDTVMASTRFVTGPGSGAGKGGGGGGSVREAGGAFGVMEAAREGQYFYKKNKEQLLLLKKHLDEQIDFHEEAIKRHTKAIEESKKRQTSLDEHTRDHQ